MQVQEIASPNFTELMLDIQSWVDEGWRISDKDGAYFSGLLYVVYLTKQEEKENASEYTEPQKRAGRKKSS